MGEVEGVDQRLTDVGVDMPRQAAQPRLDRVDGFADGGEAQAVDDARFWAIDLWQMLRMPSLSSRLTTTSKIWIIYKKVRI